MRRIYLLVPGAVGMLAPLAVLRDRPPAAAGWLCGAGALAALATLLGIRLNRSFAPRSWLLVAGALLLFAAADAVALLHRVGLPAFSYPGPADALRLAAVPLLGAALLVFVRRGTPARDWSAVLDALVVSVGVASVLWFGVLGAVVADDSLGATAHAAAIAYPVLDVLLLGLVLRLVVTIGFGVAANALVAVAMLAQLVADGAYVDGRVHGWYAQGSTGATAVDAGRLGAHLLLAVAALDPSMQLLTEVAVRPQSWTIRRRLVLLGGAVAAAIGVVAAAAVTGAVSGVTAGAAAALLALVTARLATVVFSLELSLERQDVLQRAVAALVAARTRDEIEDVATSTAIELAGGPGAAVADFDPAQKAIGTAGETVVVGGGEIGSALRGEIRRAGRLGRVGSSRTFIVPIVVRDHLRGVLRLVGRRPLSAHVYPGLETLSAQVALALESADRGDEAVERRSEARFRTLVQNSKDLIAVLEPDLTIRYVTPSVSAMLGHEGSALVGTRFDLLLVDDEPGETIALLRAEGDHEGTRGVEFRLRHVDGRPRTVEGVLSDLLEDPSVRGLVLTAHDVTERRALQDQLTHQAFHDSLTGLPNRALLSDRVAHALERSKRSGSDVAVLFLDIDDFKTINDSLGHVAGDDLLVEVAVRLRSGLRAVDTPVRLGGDEFALLLEETNGVEGAILVAQRVLDAVARPIRLGGTEVLVRASIGIAFGEPGQTNGELLRNADVAMYHAKHHGGHRYELFEPEMYRAALSRLELKAELERAFQADELGLVYQPLVDLVSGRTLGFEALLRWSHPVRGPISPAEFVPLAEEMGLINDIGRWVLGRACAQTRAWQSSLAGCGGLGINVNLSARQILQPGFREGVITCLEETGLAPEHLTLEITEGTLMEDVEGVLPRLGELRALGVRIAIDDFGTGFSSLAYLQRFPVDVLKIAREFVDDMVTDVRRARLVEAIVTVAHSLDLVTIAEGIEMEDQRERLVAVGCAQGQGYLFARPETAAGVYASLSGLAVDAA